MSSEDADASLVDLVISKAGPVVVSVAMLVDLDSTNDDPASESHLSPPSTQSSKPEGCLWELSLLCRPGEGEPMTDEKIHPVALKESRNFTFWIALKSLESIRDLLVAMIET